MLIGYPRPNIYAYAQSRCVLELSLLSICTHVRSSNAFYEPRGTYNTDPLNSAGVPAAVCNNALLSERKRVSAGGSKVRSRIGNPSSRPLRAALHRSRDTAVLLLLCLSALGRRTPCTGVAHPRRRRRESPILLAQFGFQSRELDLSIIIEQAA